jgi:hypothetical protein
MIRMASLLMGLLASVAFAGPATQPAPPVEPGVVSLPSFGISIASPKGWIRMSERSDGTVIKWIKLDETQSKQLAIVQVEVQAKTAPTLDAYADAVAEANHAKVTNRDGKVGDARAIEFVTDAAAAQKGDVHLAAGCVAEHGDYLYGFYLLAGGAGADMDALNGVTEGVKWVDYASQEDCLAARNAAQPIMFALLDTGFSFTVPDPFRFSRVVEGRERYVTYDFGKKSLDATLEISKGLVSGAKPGELEEKIAKDAGCSAAPTWTKLASNGLVYFSTVASRAADKDGAAQGPGQFILVMTPKETYCVMAFSYPSEESAGKYAAAIEGIAKSIRASGAFVAGHQMK